MRHVRRVGQLISASALLLQALVSGCDCASLFIRVGSTEHTLAVGQSFTAIVHVSGSCGTEPISEAVTWRAEDATIVRVDAATGRTTGLRPGETYVVATGQMYGPWGSVRVIVSPRFIEDFRKAKAWNAGARGGLPPIHADQLHLFETTPT